MSTIHQQIYATLVGRVDGAITVLERMTENKNFDWFHVVQVTEMLKSALLEAEDAYIEAEEPELITLPQRTEGHIEFPEQAQGKPQALPTAPCTTQDSRSPRS